MKRRNFIRKSVLIGGALASYPILSKCNREDEPEISKDYFELISLVSGFESPSGLSVYRNVNKSSLKGASNITDLEDLVFCGGPVFDGAQEMFLVKPSIFKCIGDLNTYQTLYEFTEEDISDFQTNGQEPILNNGQPVVINDQGAWRPVGVNLDTVVLGDGKIIFSSIMSNRIYFVTNGNKQVYLEDDELTGINNMILASDNKLYLAQVAIRDLGDNIIREKRVISIDSNKNINIEFNLPDGVSTHYGELIRNNMNYLEVGSQIRIIENLNKDFDSSKFYVTDQYSKVIYKVSNENLVDLLINTSSYPSGLAAEAGGMIFYITPPILNTSFTDLTYPPQLISLNPSNLEEKVLYTFCNRTNGLKYQTGRGTYTIEVNGQQYLMPVNFLITLGIVQVDNTIKIYYTDNISGEVGELSTIE